MTFPMFAKPNFDQVDWICPLCKLATEKPVILIQVANTTDDGISEAEQVHADCLSENIWFYRELKVIACKVP